MEGSNTDYVATVQHNDNDPNQENALNETVVALKALPYRIVAILAGAETGVELADSLSHRMGLRSNGEEGSLARRNKYYMGESVRNAGHRAVLQAKCSSLDQVETFIDTIKTTPFKCVCKPTQSGGSDDIFLCNTKEEALMAFKSIHGKINGLGLINDTVLVQEFLVGKEYVIDKVSRDGVHKLVAIWEYDKRSINNSHFIYFGMRLMKSDSPKMRKMIAYADNVLDALGIYLRIYLTIYIIYNLSIYLTIYLSLY
jgi:biotin carboxylase